ncbi:MAG: acyltransferase [Syntrophobacter sp.]
MLYQLHKEWRMWRLRRQGLQIADDCRLLADPSCFGSEPYLISIGRHVTITCGVRFVTHDGGTWVFRSRPEFRDVIKYGRIIIRDNCFLGIGAIIMPGVSIGPDSVVSAGAVVLKDIPPGEVWGGVPARFIRTVEEYASQALAEIPEYDRKAYRTDKKSELLRHFPYPW